MMSEPATIKRTMVPEQPARHFTVWFGTAGCYTRGIEKLDHFIMLQEFGFGCIPSHLN